MSKVKFAAKALDEALRQIGAVVDPNSGLEIYTYGRLTVKQGQGTLAGLALGATLEVKVPVKAVDATNDFLDTTFAFKTVQAIVSNIGAEEVSFEPDGKGNVAITGSGTNYLASAKARDISEFPSVPEEAYSPVATLGLPGVKDFIDKTVWAVPSDDGKYTVTTLLLHSVNKKLNFVATDGHRLVKATMDSDLGAEFRIQMPKTALELTKQLGDSSTVALFESGSTPNDGAFLFTTEAERLTVRKSSGSFPPYERVFQNTPTNLGALIIKQVDLLSSLLRLLPMADSDVPLVVLSYKASDSLLRLKAVSDAYGFAYDAITVVPHSLNAGSSFETKINGTFLKEWLEHLSGDITFFVPAANDAPLYFQNGPNYEYIMAPVVSTATAAPAPAPKAKAAAAK